MNLWANRVVQLASLLVALFFFSCEDEASVLGFKNQNQKFDASYIEIPIESSVLLLDSQRTSNFVLLQNETNRLLIGQYTDDKFGHVAANAYTQFFTNSGAKLPADVTYDSVSLQIILDFYNYGSKDALTSQSISVYELDEELKTENRKYYFNKSEALVKPTPLGSKTFTVSPKDLDGFAAEKSDTNIVVIKVPLDKAFGQRIFDNALLYRDATKPADSIFIRQSEFTKLFKGLSIKTNNGDKIIGVNPNSAVTLHYHTATADSLHLHLGFFALNNFSQIKNDRSSSDLAGLTQYAQDFSPVSDLRYIQSGTGVYTKLDFRKFFEFCDTIPNIVINSAQLSLGSVAESDLVPPSNLVLRILQSNNTLKKVKSHQDTLDISAYNPRFPAHTGTLTLDNGTYVDDDRVMTVLGDAGAFLKYSSEKKSYDGNLALFFQQLSIVRDGVPRYQYVAIYPSAPSMPNTKSVNRVIFPKDNIKLKVYYTKPAAPLN